MSLDNISCSLHVVRTRPFCFANKVERRLRIGLHASFFFFFCLALWSNLLLSQWISDFLLCDFLLNVEKKAMYSYVYSLCDFVFPCESSMHIRIIFNQETAAVRCKESMVFMKQSWT